ncbi:probable glucosamine 6-phosphate N-acetyltransferase [Agrilus planipennis]|uniref:Glucosamine 6-phosphate N-acetyltransferase n=1 Tax=Agrilus planipennis TaxID=224129 RepID=A0A1W4X5J7_AGRPL|nr:probable glucosamine 6-phosphate N-acetyltransferase [Agrilus planipennis]XP_018327663.1 probable glucosamine 6-phosphate N-acetyltransferase [Agrilus planipennis]XP_018327671.1 probable glucosamine 6-phosphate N-acetyltransferase [Agrilus planipennis]
MGASKKNPQSGNYLYNPALLQNLDWESVRGYLNPFITNENPGEPWLLVRPLQLEDYDKGLLQILSQLTTVGNIPRSAFERQFWEMMKAGGYYVTVIEDTRDRKIIGAATLITEYKFIHDCGLRGRLEDVVVNNTYRGKQLGKLIVLTVSLLAKKLGCYKMSLDCKDPLIPFYKGIGYKIEPGNSNSMIIRYETPTASGGPS